MTRNGKKTTLNTEPLGQPIPRKKERGKESSIVPLGPEFVCLQNIGHAYLLKVALIQLTEAGFSLKCSSLNVVCLCQFPLAPPHLEAQCGAAVTHLFIAVALRSSNGE